MWLDFSSLSLRMNSIRSKFDRNLITVWSKSESDRIVTEFRSICSRNHIEIWPQSDQNLMQFHSSAPRVWSEARCRRVKLITGEIWQNRGVSGRGVYGRNFIRFRLESDHDWIASVPSRFRGWTIVRISITTLSAMKISTEMIINSD